EPVFFLSSVVENTPRRLLSSGNALLTQSVSAVSRCRFGLVYLQSASADSAKSGLGRGGLLALQRLLDMLDPFAIFQAINLECIRILIRELADRAPFRSLADHGIKFED